jgi:hypothetical protein
MNRQCVSCGKPFRVPDAAQPGQQFRCPHCKTINTLPSPAPALPVQPADPFAFDLDAPRATKPADKLRGPGTAQPTSRKWPRWVLPSIAGGVVLGLAVVVGVVIVRKPAEPPVTVMPRVPLVRPPELPTDIKQWDQDFEVAKEKARKQKKDVLLFFTNSGIDPEMDKFGDALLNKDFWEPTVNRLVPVYVDLADELRPRTAIENPARNLRLWQQFGPDKLPAVLIVRPDEGHVIGTIGLPIMTPKQYADVAVQKLEGRIELAKLLQQIEKTQGPAKLTAIRDTFNRLKTADLLPYYEPELREWLRLAEAVDSPDSALRESLFVDHWKARLQFMKLQLFVSQPDAEFDARLTKLADDLKRWPQQRPYRDQDEVAKLHLTAIGMLTVNGRIEEALALVERTKAIHPSDRRIAGILALGNKLVLRFVNQGSGFFISKGHLLTNHHVIGESNAVFVLLDGRPLPAEVVADDPERDMALLRVAFPKDSVSPDAVPLARNIKPAQRVFALGFPVASLLGSEISITKGSITRLPVSGDEPLLATDAKVNPGNSGGPLCDEYGNVVGMVTLKSNLPGGDNYGFAIAYSDLEAFLKEKAPDQVLSANRETKLADDDVFARVKSSVVIVLATNRRSHTPDQ